MCGEPKPGKIKCWKCPAISSQECKTCLVKYLTQVMRCKQDTSLILCAIYCIQTCGATLQSTRCPSGHSLLAFKPGDSFTCDVCYCGPSPYSTFYGCRTCNYDLCENCNTVKKQSSSPSHQPRQQNHNQSNDVTADVTCDKGHALNYRLVYSGSYICNICQERYTGRAYHCQHCNYDLCTKCHNQKVCLCFFIYYPCNCHF